MEQVSVMDVIYRLLDEYSKYGFLFGNDGRIKRKYLSPESYEDGEGNFYGPFDTRGKEFHFGPYIADWDREDYYMTCDGEEEYTSLFNVHSGGLFKDIDRKKLRGMTVEEIKENYLRGDLEKIRNMLRRGYHYASKRPVGRDVPDDLLDEMIIGTWKTMVIGTMDAYDMKKKYYDPEKNYYQDASVNYQIDEAPYAREIYPVFLKITEKIRIESFHKSKEEREEYLKSKKKKAEEICSFIKSCFTEKEWNHLPSVKFLQILSEKMEKEKEKEKDGESAELEEFKEEGPSLYTILYRLGELGRNR